MSLAAFFVFSLLLLHQYGSSTARAPFLSALLRVRGEIILSHQFFFPGHAGSLTGLDLPELDGLDNLHAPEGVLAEALKLAQDLYFSKQSWFLVNGSTGGLLTCIVALSRARTSSCPRRSTFIICRDAHKAVFDGLWLAQCTALVLPCVVHDDFGVAVGPDLSALEGLLKEHAHDVAGLVLTRPTYQGVVLNAEALTAVCALCHNYNVPVLVDEAHGAHLRLLPASFAIKDALQCGADLVVQSSHKTLTALTQSAMMHAGPDCFSYLSPADREATLRLLQRTFSGLHSTSPSALLLASLDAARALAASPEGRNQVAEAAAAGMALREAIRGPHLQLLDDCLSFSPPAPAAAAAAAERPMYAVDPLRLSVRYPSCSDSTVVDDALCDDLGLYCELNLPSCITYCLPPSLSRNSPGFAALQKGLASAANGCYGAAGDGLVGERRRPSGDAMSKTTKLACSVALVDPTPALEGWGEEVLEVDGAFGALVGRISVETLCPYPPGIPIVIQGERLTTATVEALRSLRADLARSKGLASGRFVTGAVDPLLQTLRVYIEG